MSVKLKFKNGKSHDVSRAKTKTSFNSNESRGSKESDSLNKIIDVEFGEKSNNNVKEDNFKVKKTTNRYFYKVSNHHELFKIGSSFYKDYLTGVKSFAITSTGYQTSQQNTILGLASFFDHKEDIKIAIISDNIYKGVFKDIVSISKEVKKDFTNDDFDFNIFSFYGHFDFLDMNQILDFCNSDSGDYDELLDAIVDDYDVIFWDVPELHHIQKNSDLFFPSIMRYDSLAIIVAQSLSNSRDVEEIKLFFMGYGINLKGLIFDNNIKNNDKVINQSTDKVSKKPWWRFW